MRRLTSHSAVTVLLIAIMSVSSMGVTVVLQYCTMSHTSVCCCMAAEQGRTHTPAGTTALGGQHMPCNVQVIAGGMNAVALNAVPDTPAQTAGPDAVMPEIAIPPPIHLSSILLSYARDAAPPGGDIVIRNGALLI